MRVEGERKAHAAAVAARVQRKASESSEDEDTSSGTDS
jgi:hypothetical protein